MNFIEKLAELRLGNMQRSHYPEIAMTALNEGFESESLYILAGMNDRDNSFELEQYFNDSLEELKIEIPNYVLASKIMIRHYLNEMNQNKENAFEIMSSIDNRIYKQVDWKKILNISKVEFHGQELGLEHMFTWYRELQDFEDGGRLLYFNDLPRKEQQIKFIEELVAEGNKLKQKLEEEISTHNNAL